MLTTPPVVEEAGAGTEGNGGDDDCSDADADADDEGGGNDTSAILCSAGGQAPPVGTGVCGAGGQAPPVGTGVCGAVPLTTARTNSLTYTAIDCNPNGGGCTPFLQYF